MRDEHDVDHAMREDASNLQQIWKEPQNEIKRGVEDSSVDCGQEKLSLVSGVFAIVFGLFL